MTFEVKPNQLKENATNIKVCKNDLCSLQARISVVLGAINSNPEKSYKDVGKALKYVEEKMKSLQRDVDSMGSTLILIADKYKKKESEIIVSASGAQAKLNDAVSQKNGIVSSNTVSEKGKKEWTGNASVSAVSKDSKYSFGNGFFEAAASGMALGAAASAVTGYSAKDGEVEAHASGKASAYVADGSIESNALGGLNKFKASGTVMGAEATAKAYTTLMKNGKFSPSIGVLASADAAVAKGQVENTLGNKKYNVNGTATGSVLSASAEAGANVGKQADGSYGASANAGAGAYLAKGKVSGGITLFGVKISGEIGGGAGVGANAEAKVTTNSAEVGAGLAALVGVNAKIKIDWSNFGW